MTSGVRKFALTAHVTVSVGWIGAVAGFLALSVAGLTSESREVIRGSYLAMDTLGRYVIVPMSLAALATGVVQALGTQWGLMQHYWVVAKLLLTVAATFALLLHQFTAVAQAARFASGAAADALPGIELDRLGTQLLADASLAVVLLLVVTTLSVYKPWGKTRYGRRKQQEQLRLRTDSFASSVGGAPSLAGKSARDSSNLRRLIAIAVAGVLLAVFVALHLTGGGLGRHRF
jgi:ABC-type multidrug transport system fused ATPase/permease subunit